MSPKSASVHNYLKSCKMLNPISVVCMIYTCKLSQSQLTSSNPNNSLSFAFYFPSFQKKPYMYLIMLIINMPNFTSPLRCIFTLLFLSPN